ncbi:transcription initiation protein [Niabella ginsenosidivorans]|uniref:Transcription initiation protein n=1 Tax=Niabella ginsenosidivorans TaxID=1176587 RepID=A0A1A9I7S7_9BACT|nr:YciI family protein [Niabella ginsenosidivorans]ANH82760.1 transcription initiation protein [Niabella ginsenosidivorans]
MKEFLFIFRVDYSKMQQLPPQELQNVAESAKNWIESVAAQNKLADKGNRLVPNSGKVLKSKTLVTDGPYVETKEAINGYLIIKTDTPEAAVELAKGNPIFTFNIGGSIEVRAISTI